MGKRLRLVFDWLTAVKSYERENFAPSSTLRPFHLSFFLLMNESANKAQTEEWKPNPPTKNPTPLSARSNMPHFFERIAQLAVSCHSLTN
jgi:hypothetical protein